jgi:hypothetical protein
MSISKNEIVNEVYKKWNNVWHDINASKETRIEAFTIIKHMQFLVSELEEGNKFKGYWGEEEIADLFIDWERSGASPVFPEDLERFKQRIPQMIADLDKKILDEKKEIT